MRKQHTLAKAMFAHLSVFFAGNGTKLRISAENRFGSTRLLARKCWESLFLYNRKLPQQKPFQGRMRSILVIADAGRRFFILREIAVIAAVFFRRINPSAKRKNIFFAPTQLYIVIHSITLYPK